MKIKLFKIVAFFTIYYVVCPQINVAHANSSTNLKPLLRTKYYPPSGRAIQYNKTILPKRMVAGSKITWQISGTGQLRSIAAGSSYGTTFQQTLGTDRTPRAVLKSTGSGRITIKLYEASGAQVGKLILKRPYTFFTINLLQESGQTANYLPSGKSIRKWHLKSRGSHTLYLATEPSTNKVKLNLVTDLIWRTGFPKYSA